MSGTVIFAGGGTGGHLYPGLAIVRSLRLLSDRPHALNISFICSNRQLDAEILSRQGVQFVASPAAPFGIRPRAALKFVRAWGQSVRHAQGEIRRARASTGGAPIVIAAMGGFVAAPVVKGANTEGVPVVLVNLDAVPGKANRWIGRHAGRVFTTATVRVHRGAAAGWQTVPPIVRAEVVNSAPRAVCRSALGLDPEAKTLMVTGGSQGAKSVNDFVCAFASSPAGRAALAGWQILHQTGKGHDGAVAEAYREAGVPGVVRVFSDDMGAWWGAADVCVARAGAGNVAEVWANKVPTLFMPYPYHRDQHQRFNAMTLEEAGGAAIGTDRIDAEKNLVELGPLLSAMLTETRAREDMRAALTGLGPADGAARIARGLLEALGATPR